MMIPTIKFEIRNFETNESEEFLIENTPENFEKVASHRYTRGIEFTQTFDFQYEKDMKVPADFISPLTWVRMLHAYPVKMQIAASLCEV